MLFAFEMNRYNETTQPTSFRNKMYSKYCIHNIHITSIFLQLPGNIIIDGKQLYIIVYYTMF